MPNMTDWNRHLYAAWAPVYDQLVVVLEEKRRKSLETANIQPGEKVLLLGAGTGLDLEYLPATADITAIDITPGMISRLRKRAERLEMNVDARVMDGQKLDFPDNSFDVVVLHFVLAVIPDPTKAIREASRVLRPGGRAIILNKFCKDGSHPSFFIRTANRIARLVLTDITCQLKPLIAVSGLQRVHEEEIGFGGVFKIAVLTKDTADVPATPQLEPELQPAEATRRVPAGSASMALATGK
jgi:ubiquinone/menaquinone biosynthesis C-methylase UbiE